jgi:hypothetical protein
LVVDVREIDGQSWQLIHAWDYDAELAGVAPPAAHDRVSRH